MLARRGRSGLRRRRCHCTPPVGSSSGQHRLARGRATTAPTHAGSDRGDNNNNERRPPGTQFVRVKSPAGILGGAFACVCLCKCAPASANCEMLQIFASRPSPPAGRPYSRPGFMSHHRKRRQFSPAWLRPGPSSANSALFRWFAAVDRCRPTDCCCLFARNWTPARQEPAGARDELRRPPYGTCGGSACMLSRPRRPIVLAVAFCAPSLCVFARRGHYHGRLSLASQPAA
jgi:hypothetical protein